MRSLTLPLLCLALAMPTHAIEDERAAAARAIAETKAAAEELARIQRVERAEKAQVAAETKRLASRIDRLQADLNIQKARVDEQQQRVADFSQARDEKAQEVADLRAALTHELQAFYKAGPEVRIELASNQSGPRLVEYLRFLTRARRDRLGELLAEKRNLERSEKRLASETARLSDDIKRLEEEQRRLAESKNRQNQMLAKLDSRLNDRAARQKQMQQDNQRLTAILNQIPSNANQGKPFAQTQGNLEWPSVGKLVRSYGQTRADGQSKWNGIVIEAPQGSEVKAVKDGTVAYAGWLLGYGLLLVVEHDNGYATLYGHNQTLNKERGDKVQAGEVIARAGATGSLSQSAVFFGVNRQGQALNPKSWLKNPG